MKPTKTRKPIPKKRPKARPGRLRGKALEALRIACLERDQMHCTWTDKKGVRCNARVFDDLPDWHPRKAHMAHIHAKRNGGDSLENVRLLCGHHHHIEHSYGKDGEKPCPAKEKNDVLP